MRFAGVMGGMALVIVAAPHASAADTEAGFDAHAFTLAPGAGGLGAPLGMPGAHRFEAGDFYFGGLFEQVGATTGDAPPVEAWSAIDLAFGFAPSRVLRVDVGLPAFLSSTGTDANPVLLGDTHVDASLALVRPGGGDDQRSWGLTLHPWMDVPSGESGYFLGDAGTSGGALAAVTVGGAHLSATGDLGLGLAPKTAKVRNNSTIDVGLAMGWMPGGRVGLVAEVEQTLPLAPDAPANAWGEARVSARFRGLDGGHVVVGGALNLDAGRTAPAWRLLLGGGFSGARGPAEAAPPAPPPSVVVPVVEAPAPPAVTAPVLTAPVATSPAATSPAATSPAATMSGTPAHPAQGASREGVEDHAELPVTDGRLTLRGTVYFDGAGATLRPDARLVLDEVARTLNHHPELGRIEIAGHTDSAGEELDNLVLSQQRVDAVRDYLIQQGVPASRLLARGYGEADPMDTNLTASGRARNRRVEFRILGE